MELKVSDQVLFPTGEEGRIIDIFRYAQDDNDYKVKIHKPGINYYRGQVISVKKTKFKKIIHG